jgi:uncharacterized protein (TIGR02145 family)
MSISTSNFTLIIFSFLLFSCVNSSKVKEVRIGEQIWAVRNLDLTTFRNGDDIPQAKTNEEWQKAGSQGKPAWCYYGNNIHNGKKYGKLYNWFTVNDPRGLAPAGWHVPSDSEWTRLIMFLGDENNAGVKMKSTKGWEDIGNGTNSSGFSALPGGYRNFNGAFDFFITNGYWWSSSEENDSNARYYNLYYFNNIVTKNSDPKKVGFSVRCIRDQTFH